MDPVRRPSNREKELKRHGWTRQLVASEPRLSEAVDLYQATGYDVHLEPLSRGDKIDPEGCDDCAVCFEGFEDQYMVIYTRPKKGRGREDDLW